MRGTVHIPSTAAETKSLGLVAKYMMLGRDEHGGALAIAETENAPERVRNVLASIQKAAISSGQTSGTWGGELAGDYQLASDGFLEGVRNSSIFLRLLAGGVKQIPLRERLAITVSNATGYVRGEASARQLTSLALENEGLDPLEAVCLVIVSDELLRIASPAAVALLDRELKAGVAEAIDRQFVAILSAAATSSTASIGSTATAAAYDLRTMLDDISTNAASRLYWIGATNVAKRASALYDSGSFVFPQMSAQGGSILNLPFLVSDQVAAGKLMLVDAAGVMGNSDPVLLDVFRHADVQLDTAPDSPSTSSTVLVNLWTRNLKALLARTYFGAEVFRAGAVIEKTSISWGNSADSPA
ncbi:phage major capsid family protein [Mesorhizobium sp. LjNodule214]|uniref:phage major capsid family protein n=1 Tax=Mesorhizobium sp. LjNodule214 TaxID=3342252 RepID=UPI003ED02B42